jgi:DNA repair exonuclease SbcCD nuclease subunit
LIARNLLKDMKYLRRYETSKGAGSEKGEANLVLDTSFIKNLVNEDSSSFLLKTALEAGVNAKNLEVDKEYLEEEIVFLKEKEKEKENIAFVETNLKNIEDKIIALSKRANELNMEYLSRLVSDAVQVVRGTETSSVRSKSVKNIVLLASVVALFIAVFLAFFIEYIKNASKLSPANKEI